MMKTSKFYVMAVALCASALFASCASDLAETVQPATDKPDGYIVSINATFDENDEVTRALAVNGSGLSFSWLATEKVYAYKFNTNELVGELTPTDISADGKSCTLVGAFTGTGYTTTDKLTLCYLKQKMDGENKVFGVYTGQKGTIEDISANYDFCKATVKITSVAGNGTILGTGSASFARGHSIAKFSVRLGGTTPATNDGTRAMVESLKIKSADLKGDDGDYNTDLTIAPDVPVDVIYVALRNENSFGQDLPYYIKGIVSGLEFSCVMNAVLENNKFYPGYLHLFRDISTATGITIAANTVTEGDELDGSNLSVTDNGNPMVLGTDYTVVYKKGDDVVTSATAAGSDYTAVITGTGKYKGEKTSAEFSATNLPTPVITVPEGTDGMIITLGDDTKSIAATAAYGATPTAITSGITYSATAGADGGNLTIDASTGAITTTGGHIGTVTITITVAASEGNYNAASKTITVYVQQAGTNGSVPDPGEAGDDEDEEDEW